MVRRIISVKVSVKNVDALKIKCDMLAVGMFSDGKAGVVVEALDKKLDGAIKKLKRLGDFKGKEKTTALLYTDGKVGAKRVLLAGLGERKKVTGDTIRRAAAVIGSKAVEVNTPKVVLSIHEEAIGEMKIDAVLACQAAAEGIYFGAYRYDEFVKGEKGDRPEKIEAIIAEAKEGVCRKLGKGVRVGRIVGEAQNYARTIANRPGNVINPAAIAAEAKKLARVTEGLSCKVFDEKQLKSKKMGGILAVGQGSVNGPRLIILKYTPKGKAAGTGTAIGLVGKAITFDSGGISIKPWDGMWDMKLDKSGGLAVLGAMKAIAALRPKSVVYGIIPSAENMPGGRSYRPGDIVTTYSGKTVEIHSTDAEGRMILCDALSYAVEQGCDPIVDIATLTGSCVVALGMERAGLMSNDEGLVKKLKTASERSGERVWHLPCDDEYLELMKSKIADLKNVGGKWAGACTAGAFLGEFASDTKWAHLDIAGTGVFGGKAEGSVGSIGFGVRLLTELVVGSS